MTRTLYKICQDDDMPNRDTIYQWLNNNKGFSDNYARACTLRREERFEKMEEIPDLEEDVQRARLKIDVLKWQLSKEEPRKYGDKLELDNKHSGEVILSAKQAEQLIRARADRSDI
jgi:hypothetical protein